MYLYMIYVYIMYVNVYVLRNAFYDLRGLKLTRTASVSCAVML